MKGQLIKTEKGWIIRYRVTTPLSITTETLPLHPKCGIPQDAMCDVLDNGFAEVEFEMVTETYDDGKGCTYAKLLHHSVDTNEMIDHIGEVNEMVCMFEPTTDTSSATICKHCGKEKFLHNHVPDVGKMVEGDMWALGLEDELNKLPYTKHLDDGQYNDGQLSGFELGATWGFNKAKETLYTKEDMLKCWNTAYIDALAIDEETYQPTFYEDFIQSLKQPKQ